MKHTLKKVLALTLCAALGLSLVGGAFAADAPTTTAAEAPKPGTFDLGAVCTDDGQYVNSVIIHLEKPVDATAEELKDALTVTVKGFTINFYGFIVKDNADMPRIIDDVTVSEDGLTVTLTLRYAGEGINFFNGDTLAAKTDFELHNGTYAVEVAENVGTLTTESTFTYSGKMTDPEESKWGAVDKTDTEYNYRYFDPAQDGYKMPENGYALIVWLHGAGESVQTVDGEPVYDNMLQITANRVTAWGQKETQDMFGGAYVLAPQMDGLKNPNGWGWNPEVVMATIEAFIDKVGEETVDRNHIVIGGCSMGGMGTWETIKKYPDYFSAAFPTCGSTTFKGQDIKNLMHLPIYCIHTVEDGTVNITGTLNAYDTLKNAGKENIYLALYEHTWTVGTPDTTADDLAGLAANGHSSWIYTHNDIDGEKEADKYFLDTYTYEPTGKTYTNTKPSELGYKSFHDWLAGQVKPEVCYTTEREVVAFGEIVRSVTVHGLGLKATDKIPEIVVTVKDFTNIATGETSDVVRTGGTSKINADGSVTITYPTGMAFTENAASYKYVVTVDGKEIPFNGSISEVDDFEAVTYTTPAYTWSGKTMTTMSSRYFAPDKTAYPKPADGYPLVVWLHGGGEIGTDNRLPVSANDVHAWIEEPSQKVFGGAYVLAPQNHAAAGEGAPAATMSVILQFIEQMGDIDIGKVYVGGCSYGGIGTWQMLRNYPNFFAAGFPICCGPSGGLTDEEAKSLVNTPIYMTVSSGDDSGIVSGMIDAYNDITAAGGKDVHIAIFEHSAYEGYEDMAAAGVYIDHFSWTYVHVDYDAKGEDYDGQMFIDCSKDATYNNGAVVVKDGKLTYTFNMTDATGEVIGTQSITLNGKTERPEDTGYATFKTYLANKKNAHPSVFKDVTAETEGYDAILALALKEIAKGVTPTTYAPASTLTRAEFVTFLSRIAGANVDNTKDTGFTDVAVGSWETGAIAWAVENKLVEGYGNGKFGPKDTLTAEQVNLIVDRLIANVDGFKAADGEKLTVTGPVTRAQVAGALKALDDNFTPTVTAWW